MSRPYKHCYCDKCMTDRYTLLDCLAICGECGDYGKHVHRDTHATHNFGEKMEDSTIYRSMLENGLPLGPPSQDAYEGEEAYAHPRGEAEVADDSLFDAPAQHDVEMEEYWMQDGGADNNYDDYPPRAHGELEDDELPEQPRLTTSGAGLHPEDEEEQPPPRGETDDDPEEDYVPPILNDQQQQSDGDGGDPSGDDSDSDGEGRKLPRRRDLSQRPEMKERRVVRTTTAEKDALACLREYEGAVSKVAAKANFKRKIAGGQVEISDEDQIPDSGDEDDDDEEEEEEEPFTLPTNIAESEKILRAYSGIRKSDIASRMAKCKNCKAQLGPIGDPDLPLPTQCHRCLSIEEFTEQFVFKLRNQVQNIFSNEATWRAAMYHHLYESLPDVYYDYPDGQAYKNLVAQGIVRTDPNSCDLVAVLNTDGAHPYGYRKKKGSKASTSLWPLYCHIMADPLFRNDPIYNFIHNVDQREPEPIILTSALIPQLIEAGTKGFDGIERFDGVKCNVRVGMLFFISDNPCSAAVAGTKSHSALFLCRECYVFGRDLAHLFPGQPLPDGNQRNAVPFRRTDPVFNGIYPAELREHDEMVELMTYQMGIVEENQRKDFARLVSGLIDWPVFIDIPGFRWNDFHVGDFMHVLFNGYIKNYFGVLVERGYIDPAQLNITLEEYHKEVAHDMGPRHDLNFEAWKSFTAEEVKHFTFVYSVPLLGEWLPRQLYDTWMELLMALDLIFEVPTTEAKLRQAELHIKEHMHRVVEDFGACLLYTYVYHALIHLCKTLRQTGSAAMSGVWPYERLHQDMKALTFSDHFVGTAITNRLYYRYLLTTLRLECPELVEEEPTDPGRKASFVYTKHDCHLSSEVTTQTMYARQYLPPNHMDLSRQVEGTIHYFETATLPGGQVPKDKRTVHSECQKKKKGAAEQNAKRVRFQRRRGAPLEYGTVMYFFVGVQLDRRDKSNTILSDFHATIRVARPTGAHHGGRPVVVPDPDAGTAEFIAIPVANINGKVNFTKFVGAVGKERVVRGYHWMEPMGEWERHMNEQFHSRQGSELDEDEDPADDMEV